MNYNDIWKKVLKGIKNDINSLVYASWFEDTELYKVNGDEATIIVPTEIHCKHLLEQYYDLINKHLFNVVGSNYNLSFVLENEKDNNEKNVLENDCLQVSNIKNQYTFDNFVCGINKMTYDILINWNRYKKLTHNKLVIYGNSGVGKTHILRALEDKLLKEEKKVVYVEMWSFVEECHDIILSGKTGMDSLNKYYDVDYLLIDDLEWIATTPRVQAILHDIFSELNKRKSSIILTSSVKLDNLTLIKELKKDVIRFMQIEMIQPDLYTRKEILKQKINEINYVGKIPKEVIEFIGEKSEGDTRLLEGSLNRIIAYKEVIGQENIDLIFAKEALRGYLNY